MFPITSRVTSLKNTSPAAEQMHSVMVGRNDYDVPNPSQPGTTEFEEQVDLFLDARQRVHAGEWPDQYFETIGLDPTPPPLFERFGVTRTNPHAAAALVDHAMDHPLDLHHVFMADNGGAPTLNTVGLDRSPQTVGVDFLGFRWLDAEAARIIHLALVEAFQVKYYFTQTRPEHYFEAGPLVAEYSCPPHPSYVAGHGAIDGATVQTWTQLVDLSDAKRAEYEHAGRHHAHYRLLAGVHWAEDNTEGYELGVRVAAAKSDPAPW